MPHRVAGHAYRTHNGTTPQANTFNKPTVKDCSQPRDTAGRHQAQPTFKLRGYLLQHLTPYAASAEHSCHRQAEGHMLQNTMRGDMKAFAGHVSQPGAGGVSSQVTAAPILRAVHVRQSKMLSKNTIV